MKKLFFSKKKSDIPVSKDFTCIRDLGVTTNDIYNLAFESGEYSRYNIDRNFVRDEFKKLYACWIENSIKKIIADKSVGYYLDDKLTGIITFKAKDNKLDIGLIAVDKEYGGKKLVRVY
jgi:dTDP-4-amino-4,6-dideoxy-D-galactose acyltransferase